MSANEILVKVEDARELKTMIEQLQQEQWTYTRQTRRKSEKERNV